MSFSRQTSATENRVTISKVGILFYESGFCRTKRCSGFKAFLAGDSEVADCTQATPAGSTPLERSSTRPVSETPAPSEAPPVHVHAEQKLVKPPVSSYQSGPVCIAGNLDRMAERCVWDTMPDRMGMKRSKGDFKRYQLGIIEK